MSPTRSLDTATLTLLGGWQLALGDGTPAEPDYEKGRALLAYLAMEDQLHSRAALSELFWPGSKAGRANLRQVLANLRSVLQDSDWARPCILVKRDTLRINPQGRLRPDAAALTATAPPNASLAQLEHRVGLYQGEFMAGFSLPDCRAFEEWLQNQREALQRRALALLEQLSNGHEQLGDYSRALQFALRYASLEPWDEGALRRVMRLYALNGQYAAALVQFETCCRMLKGDLGVLPSEETQQMAERVRQGDWQTRPPRPKPPAPSTPLRAPAERRQVTVLYCDMSLTDGDDPDEAMALLSKPQARCVEIIRQLSGHIVQTHGGGLLAYFGYPHAHEDAARRAVQAALAVTHEAMEGLEIRAGVHTGLIITGGDAAMPDTVGKTSRLAIELRFCAGRNEIAISDATHRIVGGYFDCFSQGQQLLPGLAQPLEVFTVQAQSGARTRLDAALQLSPFGGRDAELAQLLARWEQSAQGDPGFVLIQGEAGIGKSRLLRVFKERLANTPHAIRELHCFPEFSQSPFRPLIVMFEAIFAFGQDDTSEQKFGKLASYLQKHYPAATQEDTELLARLLALAPVGPWPEIVPVLSPQKAKGRTIGIVLEMLQALAAEQPTLVIVEDLHWIDPSTLELLSLYANGAKTGAVLTIFTARPEFSQPWTNALDARLALGPLHDDDLVAMVRFMGRDIDAATVRSIVERADGVPLFAEEMAKMACLGECANIPSTLQDLLAARMDQLGEAKYLAQLAATLGREFALNLLHKVFEQPGEVLASHLTALHDAGLIVTTSAGAGQFKHALVQQAAYQSQSKADQQATHRRVAQALQSHFPALLESRPELMAQHLSCGGASEQSIRYWIKAGQRAALSSANLEAIAHFRSGLKLLTTVPPGQGRDGLECKLLIGLCPVLYAAKGYGCEEAAQASARIAALSQQLADRPKVFQTQWALLVSTIAGSGSRGMPQAAMQLLEMAQDDPLKKMAAHTLAALASFWLGDFESTRIHDEKAIALYHPDQRQALVRQFGSDLLVNCASYFACSLYFLGYPGQAQTACQRMLDQARALAHPHTLAQALSFAALLQRWLNLPAQALALSAEAIAISREHEFHLWLACGEMTHGWALVKMGRPEGFAEIESSIAAMRLALGGISIVFLSSRIEACVHLKHYDEALARIAQAQADAEKTGDGHFLAELYRLKGVCLLELAPASPADAQFCLEQALSISRRQHAKSLELRAATSLARLWQQQGRPQDARRILEKIHKGFSEGFDSHDLQAAARLLQSLRKLGVHAA